MNQPKYFYIKLAPMQKIHCSQRKAAKCKMSWNAQ